MKTNGTAKDTTKRILNNALHGGFLIDLTLRPIYPLERNSEDMGLWIGGWLVGGLWSQCGVLTLAKISVPAEDQTPTLKHLASR
jgi:hypothetical protein